MKKVITEEEEKKEEISAEEQAEKEPVGDFALDEEGEVFWNG